jgi:uncharacterized membrane protein HdeD (DUF308 family)
MPKDLLTAAWRVLLLRGVVGIVLGIVLIAWPESTIVVLVVLWGVWALVEGIALGAQVFTPGGAGGQRVLFAVMALVSVVVAFLAFTRPGMAATALTWVLGIWLLVRGVFELVGALTSRTGTPRWLLLLGAGLDIVLGWLFLANPGRSAVAIAVVIGIAAVAWGIVFVALALMARRAAHEVGNGPSVPASSVA